MAKPKPKPKSGKGTSSGKSYDELLQEAFACLEAEDGRRAERILRKLLGNGAGTAEVRMGLAEALFLQGMALDGDAEAEFAIRLAESEEEKAQLLAIKANVVLTAGYVEVAAQAFMRIDTEYPQYTARHSPVLVSIMVEQGREKEAWGWFEDRLANLEKMPAVDVAFYHMAWLELAALLCRTEFKDKLTRAFKRAAEKVANPEERSLLVGELATTAARVSNGMQYREAEWFVDLALSIDPSFLPMVEAKRELKRFAAVQIEIDRMSQDESLFPIVTLRASEWFYQDDEGNIAGELWDEFPEDVIEMLYQDHQALADGIERLKAKYPAVYAMFREDWDEMYEEMSGKNGNIVRFPRD